MYRNFSIQSSLDGHVGGFHVLTIVNNAAVNIGVHRSFQILVLRISLDKYPEVVLLDRTAVPFLVF